MAKDNLTAADVAAAIGISEHDFDQLPYELKENITVLADAANAVVVNWTTHRLAEAVRALERVLSGDSLDDEEPPTEGQRASREATARMVIIPGMNDDE